MSVRVVDVPVHQLQAVELARLTPRSSEHSAEHVVGVPMPGVLARLAQVKMVVVKIN